MAELFPIFLKLNGRNALVVGGGKMAAVRAKQLLRAGAGVMVVSKAGSEIESLAKAKSWFSSAADSGEPISIGATL